MKQIQKRYVDRSKEYWDYVWIDENYQEYKKYINTQYPYPFLEYFKQFKVAKVCDVGLLRRLSLLALSAFGEGNRLFVEFKGALSENYALQALQNQFEAMPRYWAIDNPRYEVDFLIQRENDILPVEVKSEINVESRSLKKYKEKYSDKVKLRIRFSLNNLRLDHDLLNIPLFMADYADKLIGMALDQVK